MRTAENRAIGPSSTRVNSISKLAAILLLICACVSCARTAHAFFGVPYFTPERPQVGDTVYVNVSYGGCDGFTGPDAPEVTQNGDSIYMLAQGVRFTDPAQCTLPEGIATFAIGMFPAGSYDLRLDVRYPNAGGDFVVEMLCHLVFSVYNDAARPHIDLSLHVSVSPGQFTPGGRNAIALAVHNNGPDEAGAVVPGVPTIDVLQDPFSDAEGGTPFEIRAVSGCFAIKAVGDPGNIVGYAFLFEAIAAGETRTCTYEIEFYPWSFTSFPMGWQVYSPNDIETDPSNDRVDHLFQVAGGPAAPTAVDAGSALSLGFLMLALAALSQIVIGTQIRAAVRRRNSSVY